MVILRLNNNITKEDWTIISLEQTCRIHQKSSSRSITKRSFVATYCKEKRRAKTYCPFDFTPKHLCLIIVTHLCDHFCERKSYKLVEICHFLDRNVGFWQFLKGRNVHADLETQRWCRGKTVNWKVSVSIFQKHKGLREGRSSLGFFFLLNISS